MPDPAGTYTDGAIKFGSQIVTITADTLADVAYIAEDFSLEKGANWSESHDENGVPNKQYGRSTIPTGSLTLQFPASDSPLPALFAEFTALAAGSTTAGGSTTVGIAVTLIVASVGEKYTSDGEAKINITVRRKINT